MQGYPPAPDATTLASCHNNKNYTNRQQIADAPAVTVLTQETASRKIKCSVSSEQRAASSTHGCLLFELQNGSVRA
eukprot:5775559-Pleurochrysis_carterae.AAC.2